MIAIIYGFNNFRIYFERTMNYTKVNTRMISTLNTTYRSWRLVLSTVRRGGGDKTADSWVWTFVNSLYFASSLKKRNSRTLIWALTHNSKINLVCHGCNFWLKVEQTNYFFFTISNSFFIIPIVFIKNYLYDSNQIFILFVYSIT